MALNDLLKNLKKAPASNVIFETINQVSDKVNDKVEPVVDSIATKQTSNSVAEVISYILLAGLVLYPVLFLPMLANSYDLPKQTVILLISLVSAVLLLFRAAITRRLSLVRSIFDLPVLLFIVLAAFSAFNTPNKYASLASDPLLYTGGALFFFLLGQTVSSKEQLQKFLTALLVPGAILSVLAVVQATALIITQFVKTAVFSFPLFASNINPAGSALSALMFLLVTLPIALAVAKGKNSLAIAAFYLDIVGMLASALILYRNPPVILPMQTSWRIATYTIGQSLTGTFVDTLLRIPTDSYSALFGTGPGNFVDAFTMFKAADFNNTPYWNLKFASGSNFYFYLLTTVGIAGLAAFLFLVYRVITHMQKRFKVDSAGQTEKSLWVSLAIALLLLVFMPAPSVLILSLFAVLGLLVAQLRVSETRELARLQIVDLSSGLFNFFPALFMAIVALVLGIYFGKLLLADYFFAQSLVAAAANRGTQTYNSQIQAINLNPDNDVYHSAYSQTNLALANALAAQPDLTDQQKQAVVQLVQQAIREGRVAVSLAPRRSGDYENLSLIYRSLINFAQGADQWSIASLNQAINFDPTNPRLRLDLGGIYFAAGDYTSAAQLFNQAAGLKSDYANARYNLAEALKNLKLYDQARSELQLTASLVCTPGNNNGADCQKVNQEINALATTAPETKTNPAVPETPQQLSTPSAQKSWPKAAKPASPVTISSGSGEITP